MEQLLDDNRFGKSQHQASRESSRLRVKRNYHAKSGLLLHSSKLHKLSRQLLQLKVTKSTNRTTAQFFSTACYRRHQFGLLRAAILFLSLGLLYLYWCHRTLFAGDAPADHLRDYGRLSDASPHQTVNPAQTDPADEQLADSNLDSNLDRTDDADRRAQPENEREKERQHLLERGAIGDRSFAKLDFNSYERTEKQAKFNKEIRESRIQDNDQRTSSVSSAANSPQPAERTGSAPRSSSSRPFGTLPIGSPSISHPLPAHISQISEPIVDSLKNYSFLGKANYPVSKSNRSSSVSSIFPVERRTSSILEKQLAWYELVGITMFNLLGSSLAGHGGSANEKFKNQTNLASPNSSISEIETVLLRPISSSAFDQQRPAQQSAGQERPQADQAGRERASVAANNQTSGLMKNLKQSLPQCIIIGVRKAGTRAILEYLTLNDRIRKADNEVHFFDTDERYALGLDYYRNQMPYTTAGQIGIEKSPAYFVTSTVPERIRTMNASIKLILIVRDPVTRLISDYTQLTHNKLLKLDDLMRISGPNRPQQQQQQQQQKLENHLSKFLLSSASSFSEFPVDKKAKIRSEQQKATNEQFAVLGEPRSAAAAPNNLGKKIEKRPHDENGIVEKSHLTTDYYWSRIGSEPDYRKAEQLDEIEQDADAFVSLPFGKREKRRTGQPRNRAASADGMNKILSSRRPKSSRAIDFKWNGNSKVIDSNASARSTGRTAYRKTKQPNIDRPADRASGRAARVSREALEPNAEPPPTDDEDEVYRPFGELSPDDEDVELNDQPDDDYLSSEKQQIKQAPTNRGRSRGGRPAAYNDLHNSAIRPGGRPPSQSIEQAAKSNQDDHYHRRIPKFEELVIRNGQVNTNYRPVKTSIYSLYMDNWLRVFRRDQIHIVDGDRLIKQPHVELNKIETFLGLVPNQIHQNHFVFNRKKNFFCARMHDQHGKSRSPAIGRSTNGQHQPVGSDFGASANSSTSWPPQAANRKPNKTAGRHSSIRCLNSSKGRPHPQVDSKVISKLRQFYAPFNRHFERLVGIKFNWPEI